jgi:hypothetical protein
MSLHASKATHVNRKENPTMTSQTNNPQNDKRGQGNDAQRGNDQQNRDRSSQQSGDEVQGEGDYKSAREFDEAERKFVESGKVDAAARAAAPRSEAEEQEMLDAERKGKSRAKEEDPAVKRPQNDKIVGGGSNSRKR